MEKIPQDIILDIVLRLPPQSIIYCKLVCKPWRDLLSNIKLKLDILFLVGEERNIRKDLQLYHGGQQYNDIDIHGSYSCKTLIKFDNHSTFPEGCWSKLVGSCNGLVCFSVEHDLVYDPTYICNPVTGEFVNLPKYLLVDEDYEKPNRLGGDFISGFGYSVSTDEYKVVRMYAGCGYPYKDRSLKVQVYTLGSGLGWRDKGRANIYMPESETSVYENGVFANGALHWIVRDGHQIQAFDLADEKFISIPLPLDYSRMDIGYLILTLKLLGGYLSVYHVTREFVHIWSLKKKKQCNSYDMGEEEFDNYWSWNIEFSIPSDGGTYHPFAVTESKQVLLWFDGFLCCYDSKTTTFTKLWRVDSTWSCVQANAHLICPVSLKALGEKSLEKENNWEISSQLCELQSLISASSDNFSA